jgi:hemoglobin
MSASESAFEKIGEGALRAVLADFYRRVFADVMIGFMFAGKDRAHLVDREYELVAALLGAPGIKYTGMPMRAAHAKHTIFGGHFERRMQILRETLRDHAVDADVQRVWLDHAESLRGQITGDRGSECGTTAETLAGKLTAAAPPAADPGKPIKLGRR